MQNHHKSIVTLASTLNICSSSWKSYISRDDSIPPQAPLKVRAHLFVELISDLMPVQMTFLFVSRIVWCWQRPTVFITHCDRRPENTLWQTESLSAPPPPFFSSLFNMLIMHILLCIRSSSACAWQLRASKMIHHHLLLCEVWIYFGVQIWSYLIMKTGHQGLNPGHILASVHKLFMWHQCLTIFFLLFF